MAKDLAKQSSDTAEVERVLDPVVVAIIDRVKATGRYGSAGVFLLKALDAQTIEEATDTGQVLGAKENVLGERLRMTGVTFLDSDPELESTVPIFAVIDCFRELDGTQVKVSCGAEQVLGVLIRACEMDWFPFDAELYSVSLGKAKNAINLRLAPQRVDQIGDSL